MYAAKGRLNQEHQGIQSTKPPKTYDDQLKVMRESICRIKKNIPMGKTFEETLEKDILNNIFPLSDNPNTKTNEVIY